MLLRFLDCCFLVKMYVALQTWICYLHFIDTQKPNSCANKYIHRARLYHFISICPITYFLSFSASSAKPDGHLNCSWAVALQQVQNTCKMDTDRHMTSIKIFSPLLVLPERKSDDRSWSMLREGMGRLGV